MMKFRLLTADEIECRIGSTTTSGFSLLLYKTARTDANLLDETVGAENWQNDFKEVGGVLYGGIGIYNGGNAWIWKWDAGTESNTEAEKGRASDAFKRAGFKWGIGRELYTAPFIWIQGADKKDRFTVTEIGYDENRKINHLTVYNETAKTVAYTMGAKSKTVTVIAETPKTTPANVCADCGTAITKDEASFSNRFYGMPLCRDCQKKHKK